MLQAAVAGRRQPVELEHDDLAVLAEAAVVHRVPGYVQRWLRETGVPERGGGRRGAAAGLVAASTQATAGHLRCLADLARLRSLLDDRGARWCVFKGPAVTELLHGDADLRLYSDLDVLVHPGDVGAVVTRLEEAGAVVLDAHWRTLLAWQHTQFHLRLWSGTTLDLHWHLINEWYDRDAFAVDTDAVLRRVRRVDLCGGLTPTLDPVDTLVNLCVHAATAGGQRLSWLRDIQLAARAPGVDASTLARRTAASGTRLVTATMLCVAATALGDQYVVRMGRRLAPGASWVRLAIVVARLSPAARWRGADHVTLGWALCRSTRQSTGRSVVIALRGTPRLLRRRVTSARVRAALRPSWDRLRRLTGAGRRRARILPHDGPHARDAYLDWVAGSTPAARSASSARARPSDEA